MFTCSCVCSRGPRGCLLVLVFVLMFSVIDELVLLFSLGDMPSFHNLQWPSHGDSDKCQAAGSEWWKWHAICP